MRPKSKIREWVESILIALALAIVVRILFFEPYKIPTGSMQKTLMVGDIILVNKIIYGPRLPFVALRLPGFKKPQRGDVVVFIYPEDPKKNFIKRLVAKEGETVLIESGTIYVNDKPLLDNIFSRNFYYNAGDYAREGIKITVPKDSYFALGDNSANSQDGRYWGFIPEKNMLGKAIFIYWPLNRIRAIK